jgi:hypothetical protein
VSIDLGCSPSLAVVDSDKGERERIGPICSVTILARYLVTGSDSSAAAIPIDFWRGGTRSLQRQ